MEVCLLTFMGLWIRSLMNISWYHYGSKYWNSIMKTSDLVDTEDLLLFFFKEHSLKVVWKLLLEWLHLLLCSCSSQPEPPRRIFCHGEAETKIRTKQEAMQYKISHWLWGEQQTSCKFKNQIGVHPERCGLFVRFCSSAQKCGVLSCREHNSCEM